MGEWASESALLPIYSIARLANAYPDAQLGLLAFSGMQLLPIFTLFPGVHQWDVKIKYLGEWGKVSCRENSASVRV